jgi:hypothetical protein
MAQSPSDRVTEAEYLLQQAFQQRATNPQSHHACAAHPVFLSPVPSAPAQSRTRSHCDRSTASYSAPDWRCSHGNGCGATHGN